MVQSLRSFRRAFSLLPCCFLPFITMLLKLKAELQVRERVEKNLKGTAAGWK
jgi:hypothetical protein